IRPRDCRMAAVGRVARFARGGGQSYGPRMAGGKAAALHRTRSATSRAFEPARLAHPDARQSGFRAVSRRLAAGDDRGRGAPNHRARGKRPVRGLSRYRAADTRRTGRPRGRTRKRARRIRRIRQTEEESVTPPEATLAVPYWHVDAFAERPFIGNQAAVMILDEWPPDDILQKIGEENNFAET